MFSDLRKAGGGRDGELLCWKVGSSNMHMENANLIEDLDWNQERKIIQKINIWHCSPTVTDPSESRRDALSVFPQTLTKSKMSVTSHKRSGTLSLLSLIHQSSLGQPGCPTKVGSFCSNSSNLFTMTISKAHSAQSPILQQGHATHGLNSGPGADWWQITTHCKRPSFWDTPSSKNSWCSSPSPCSLLHPFPHCFLRGDFKPSLSQWNNHHKLQGLHHFIL